MTDSGPTVVLLAAGLGTRYGDLKQLDPVGVGGAAILDYTLADAARAGFRRAVLVVRPEIADRVARHLERTGAGGLPATLAHQTLDAPMPPGASSPPGREKPWGTAQAVLAAAPELDGAFAVANADDHYGAGALECLAEWLDDGAAGPGPEPGDAGRDAGGPGGADTEGTGRPGPADREAPDRAGRAPPEDAAVVGYRLQATLSEHGGVSRAVCEADGGGRLLRIREVTGVRSDADGTVRGRVGDEERVLDPDARISMNLWGLRPSVVPVLRAAFRDFLASGPDAGAELHLPDVVGAALASGRLRARLLACGEGWFGITWPEDRDGVVRRLSRRGPPGADAAADAHGGGA